MIELDTGIILFAACLICDFFDYMIYYDFPIIVHLTHHCNHSSDIIYTTKFHYQEQTMIKEEYPHSEITEKIIGCAMKVHNILGNGFQEIIYQRALAIEMTRKGLSFTRELEMPIFYEDEEIGTRRVDFFVEEKVLVEIKAIIRLEDVHLAQAINYLEAYNMEVGLLINFGNRSLQFRRVGKPEKIKQSAKKT